MPKAQACKNNSDVQLKPSSDNAMQAQLNFMGLFGRSQVKSAASVFNKYLEKMDHYKFENTTILYRKTDGSKRANIILLDEPQKFSEALSLLAKKISDFSCGTKKDVQLCLLGHEFEDFAKALNKNRKLKHTYIKGIVGQGGSSTAFLTDKNDVIKLAIFPIFPSEKDFIKGVEIPITKRYAIKSGYTGAFYAMREPLAENHYLRDVTNEEYGKIWADFNQKIKTVNPEYKFADDFDELDCGCSSQIGFINDMPYILDHQVIKNRFLDNTFFKF